MISFWDKSVQQCWSSNCSRVKRLLFFKNAHYFQIEIKNLKHVEIELQNFRCIFCFLKPSSSIQLLLLLLSNFSNIAWRECSLNFIIKSLLMDILRACRIVFIVLIKECYFNYLIKVGILRKWKNKALITKD